MSSDTSTTAEAAPAAEAATAVSDGWSTNGMTSWAVDLGEIGAIYPFQGYEGLMVVAGVVFWIGWHVMQFRVEADELSDEMEADPTGEQTKEVIERY